MEAQVALLFSDFPKKSVLSKWMLEEKNSIKISTNIPGIK